MTDLALVAALGTMAALLGAAALAIVLLYRGWKSNRAQITELRAQLATAQIAALTGRPSTVDGDSAETTTPEPARRKRHLSLYIGGGVVAAFVSCREGLRNLVRSHTAVTAVAAVATVGAAAALALSPSDETGNPEPGSPATGQEPEALEDAQAANERPTDELQEDEEDTAAYTPADQGRSNAAVPATTAAPEPVPDTDAFPDTPGAADSPSAAPLAPQDPPPAEIQDDDPEPAKPAPPAPAPAPGAEDSQPLDDHSGLCVDARPLLDLCLLTGR